MIHSFDNLIKDFGEYNLSLTEKQLEQLDKYYELLVDWNNKINLTAITDFDEVCKLHFVDSISSSQFYDFKKEFKSY